MYKKIYKTLITVSVYAWGHIYFAAVLFAVLRTRRGKLYGGVNLTNKFIYNIININDCL